MKNYRYSKSYHYNKFTLLAILLVTLNIVLLGLMDICIKTKTVFTNVTKNKRCFYSAFVVEGVKLFVMIHLYKVSDKQGRKEWTVTLVIV